MWVLSIVGNWCNFLTLFYISKTSLNFSQSKTVCDTSWVFYNTDFDFSATAFVVLHTVPLFYEKYEDQVDSYSEKATIELKKHYYVFDEKVLSKIPKGPLKKKD